MMPILTLGSFSIPTFFIVISLSLSFLMIYLSQRVDRMHVDRKVAFDIAILLMISGFIGGRAMHVFYEEWPYYQKYPWQILYFWQGGYVFFGGFILCVVASYVYCKMKKVDYLEMADFFAPLASLSHAFGRLGCFFSGCCYGSLCDLPWSIEGRHPTTLYLSGGELLIFAYLIFFEKKIKAMDRPDLKGAVFVKWVLLHSLMRLIVEYYRDDFRGAFYSLPLFGRLSVSQVVCVFLILLCGIFFAGKIKKRTV
jgi:phosphatidylglycerol:prolipoprotein diacylglycerol transferase